MPTLLFSALLIVSLVTTSVAAKAKNLPPVNFIGCRADATLFFSYSKYHQWAVEICEVAGGYRYTFGHFKEEGNRLRLLPEEAEQVVLEPHDIGLIHRDLSSGFAIKRGETFTWLETETNGSVNLVTASRGWTGWGKSENREAIPLDVTGWGFINQLDHLTLPPFAYDNTTKNTDP